MAVVNGHHSFLLIYIPCFFIFSECHFIPSFFLCVRVSERGVKPEQFDSILPLGRPSRLIVAPQLGRIGQHKLGLCRRGETAGSSFRSAHIVSSGACIYLDVNQPRSKCYVLSLCGGAADWEEVSPVEIGDLRIVFPL